MNLFSFFQILAEANNDKLTRIALFIAIFVFFIPVFLLTIIVCIKTIIKKRRKYRGVNVPKVTESKSLKKKKNEEQHYEDLFGGDDNIISIKKELNRVTLTVKDLDLVQLDKLQELKIGVLIVGNMVKCSSNTFAEYFDEKN